MGEWKEKGRGMASREVKGREYGGDRGDCVLMV